MTRLPDKRDRDRRWSSAPLWAAKDRHHCAPAVTAFDDERKKRLARRNPARRLCTIYDPEPAAVHEARHAFAA